MRKVFKITTRLFILGGIFFVVNMIFASKSYAWIPVVYGTVHDQNGNALPGETWVKWNQYPEGQISAANDISDIINSHATNRWGVYRYVKVNSVGYFSNTYDFSIPQPNSFVRAASFPSNYPVCPSYNPNVSYPPFPLLKCRPPSTGWNAYQSVPGYSGMAPINHLINPYGDASQDWLYTPVITGLGTPQLLQDQYGSFSCGKNPYLLQVHKAGYSCKVGPVNSSGVTSCIAGITGDTCNSPGLINLLADPQHDTGLLFSFNNNVGEIRIVDITCTALNGPPTAKINGPRTISASAGQPVSISSSVSDGDANANRGWLKYYQTSNGSTSSNYTFNIPQDQQVTHTNLAQSVTFPAPGTYYVYINASDTQNLQCQGNPFDLAGNRCGNRVGTCNGSDDCIVVNVSAPPWVHTTGNDTYSKNLYQSGSTSFKLPDVVKTFTDYLLSYGLGAASKAIDFNNGTKASNRTWENYNYSDVNSTGVFASTIATIKSDHVTVIQGDQNITDMQAFINTNSANAKVVDFKGNVTITKSNVSARGYVFIVRGNLTINAFAGNPGGFVPSLFIVQGTTTINSTSAVTSFLEAGIVSQGNIVLPSPGVGKKLQVNGFLFGQNKVQSALDMGGSNSTTSALDIFFLPDYYIDYKNSFVNGSLGLINRQVVGL